MQYPHAVEVQRYDSDVLATISALACENKQVTPESILIRQMQSALETIPEEFKPFALAVIEIFKRQQKEIHALK
jgi:hypothetical protein